MFAKAIGQSRVCQSLWYHFGNTEMALPNPFAGQNRVRETLISEITGFAKPCCQPEQGWPNPVVMQNRVPETLLSGRAGFRKPCSSDRTGFAKTCCQREQGLPNCFVTPVVADKTLCQTLVLDRTGFAKGCCRIEQGLPNPVGTLNRVSETLLRMRTELDTILKL